MHVKIMKSTAFLFCCFLSVLFTSNAQNFNEIVKAVATDRAANDQYGVSVSVSGDYAIVGAFGEDEDSSGSNTETAAGSAYILKYSAGTWSQHQKIVASDRKSNDYFGFAVAISGDYAIIGAYADDEDSSGANYIPSSGSAYIFKNCSGTWYQVQKIVATDRGLLDYFGRSVAINGDYAIVGCEYEDEDEAGADTKTSSGSAYVYKNCSGTWYQVEKVVASDRAVEDYFGKSVAIYGDYAIVGAWEEDEDVSGSNTMDGSGSAYIFKNNSGTWSQLQKIVASDRAVEDFFGNSVAISGDYALIGAYGEDHDGSGNNSLDESGSVYIFKNNSGTWSQLQKIVATDRDSFDYFGFSLAISGNYAVVGAYYEDYVYGSDTSFESGSAYIFKLISGSWKQVQKFLTYDRESDDNFSYSLSMDGNYILAGARYEDEDASGANTLSDAGSAYVFYNCHNDALSFNGSTNYVDIGIGPTSVKTIEAWVNMATNTEYIIDLNGSSYIYASSGTVTTSGITSPTIYVNGVQTSSIASGTYQHIAVTTSTAVNASNFDVGRVGSNYYSGKIDEVRLWDDVRSQSEINEYLYNELLGNESNLLAYYKMSNGSGSSLADDQTSGSYDGSLINSPGWVTSGCFSDGRNCLYFDGSNDYVNIPSVSWSAIGTNDFSIEAWIYPVVLTGSVRLVLCDNTEDNFQFNLSSGGSTLQMFINTTATSSNSLSWNLNQWYHIAVTRNSGTISFYRDGIYIGGGSNTGSIASSSSLNMGYRNYESDYPFNGMIDEVRIWSISRTAEEIRENMGKTLCGREKGLLAYYRFDYGTPGGSNSALSTLYDITSNDNNGSLTNFALSGSSSNWVSSTAFNTWLGSEGTNWASDNNWSSGSEPVSTDHVFISASSANYPVLSSSSSIKDLIVSTGSQLTINAGGSLTVSDNIINNSGTNGVIINSTASGSGSIISSSSIPANVKRYVAVGTSAKNHFFSSPISDGTIASIFGSASYGSYNTYEFNISSQLFVRNFPSANMTPGLGYVTAYAHTSSTPLTNSFAGSLNSGTVSPTISGTDQYWNLIGNPYPCAVDLTDATNGFLKSANNNNITGTAYFWIDDGTEGSGYTTADYATINSAGSTGSANGETPSQYVGTGQGFFVQSNGNGSSVSFTAAMKVAGNNSQFFVPDPVTFQRIRLSVTDSNNNYNEILLAFIEDASWGFDHDYDGRKLKGNPELSFYSLMKDDTNGYAIQGFPSFQKGMVIPVGLDAHVGGEYNLKLKEMENFGYQKVYLKDKFFNKITDLTDSREYTFISPKGTFKNRFEILFSLTNHIAGADNNEISVFSVGNSIFICNQDKSELDVQVFDMLGKLHFERNISDSGFHSFEIGGKTGYYVIKVKSGNEIFSRKLLIQK
ncbi:MAG: T9SS type A sorting domain-containing protein [Bacteroidetes bacterium]|nr:T9SS type A sorting domain-containing protein [Bacteroidota bacterium]